jgi:hypothetical protein
MADRYIGAGCGEAFIWSPKSWENYDSEEEEDIYDEREPEKYETVD